MCIKTLNKPIIELMIHWTNDNFEELIWTYKCTKMDPLQYWAVIMKKI